MARPLPGDHFTRTWHGITIYGYAMTEQEFLESERKYGADQEELDYQQKAFRRWLHAGLLYGMAYSIACVQGELGSTPIREATLITQEAFEQAKQKDWSD